MEIRRILIEYAAGRDGLVSRDEVRKLGIGPDPWRRLVRSDEWVEIVPDMFHHAATAVTFNMEVRAGSWWLGERGALFGQTALHWLSVPVVQPRHASFLVPRSLRQIPGWMEIHTTQSLVGGDVVRRQGIRTSTATRAILDWATQGVRAGQLEEAIDESIRRRLTALPRLSARLSATGGRGRPGTALLRELLLDSGGESHLERRFLALVRHAGLPRPTCQVVHRRGSTTVARVDFQWPLTNIVVEVSGRLGHRTDAERARDARRRNHLQMTGHVILEFTTAHVIDDPAYVVGELREALSPFMSRPFGRGEAKGA